MFKIKGRECNKLETGLSANDFFPFDKPAVQHAAVTRTACAMRCQVGKYFYVFCLIFCHVTW